MAVRLADRNTLHWPNEKKGAYSDGLSPFAVQSRYEFLERMLESIEDTVYAFDIVNRKTVYCNRRLHQRLGYTDEWAEELGSSVLQAIIHPEDWAHMAVYHAQMRENPNQPLFRTEIRARRPNGEIVWLSSRDCVMERDEEGRPTIIAGVTTDITEQHRDTDLLQNDLAERAREANQLTVRQKELERVNTLLSRQAATDGLTGLYNHRVFQELLESEVERAYATREKLSLLLLDVDHFKNFNDKMGHPAGDEVLARLASIIKQVTRESDVAARYGGEEFVILLPETCLEGCIKFAERLINAIREEPWSRMPITASLGCAAWTRGESKASFLERADRALYESKRNGRNQITAADQ